MALEISKKDKVRSDFESFILYFLRAIIHLPYIWCHLRSQEGKKRKPQQWPSWIKQHRKEALHSVPSQSLWTTGHQTHRRMYLVAPILDDSVVAHSSGSVWTGRMWKII